MFFADLAEINRLGMRSTYANSLFTEVNCIYFPLMQSFVYEVHFQYLFEFIRRPSIYQMVITQPSDRFILS